MKKLNLKEVEKLSREQLKNVLGGWTEESGSNDGETVQYPGICTDPSYPVCMCEGTLLGCLEPSVCTTNCKEWLEN